MLDFFDFSARRAPFAEPPELAEPLNPFRGPLPANSQNASLFHPIATAVPGAARPGSPNRRPPTHADALIRRHTRRALA